MPFTSYVESELCQRLIDEHSAVFSHGVFTLTGSKMTVDQALGEAEEHYSQNPARLGKYRRFSSADLPPYTQRTIKATKHLQKKWIELSRLNDPAHLFGQSDRNLQQSIEKNWDGVLSSIGAEAMISENVGRLLFDGRKSRSIQTVTDSLTMYLGDEYFSNVSSEFGAHVFDGVPYMLNTLNWGQFEKLNFSHYTRTIGARFLATLNRTEPDFLLEEVERMREQLWNNGVMRPLA